jgi:hypothetical protein
MGRWPSRPEAVSIDSIRKQPGQVLGHMNSLAISKCRWLPEPPWPWRALRRMPSGG